MISVYKDEITDLLFPRKGLISKNKNPYIDIAVQRTWKAEEIKKLRKSLRLSQALFADLIAANVNTVISWEVGRNTPTSMACRMFEILKNYPDCILEAGIVKFKGNS